MKATSVQSRNIRVLCPRERQAWVFVAGEKMTVSPTFRLDAKGSGREREHHHGVARDEVIELGADGDLVVGTGEQFDEG